MEREAWLPHEVLQDDNWEMRHYSEQYPNWPWCTLCAMWTDADHVRGKKHQRKLAAQQGWEQQPDPAPVQVQVIQPRAADLAVEVESDYEESEEDESGESSAAATARDDEGGAGATWASADDVRRLGGEVQALRQAILTMRGQIWDLELGRRGRHQPRGGARVRRSSWP